MLHDRNEFVLVEILGITLFNRMKELWFKGIDDLKPVLFANEVASTSSAGGIVDD